MKKKMISIFMAVSIFATTMTSLGLGVNVNAGEADMQETVKKGTEDTKEKYLEESERKLLRGENLEEEIEERGDYPIAEGGFQYTVLDDKGV